MKTALLLCCSLPLLAQAQVTCDQFVIQRFTHAPFDEGLHVELLNDGSGFASYPYFDLVNDQGDTVANGSVFFFGIASGMVQLHQLELNGPPPASPFTGELVLHYLGSLTDTLCVYPLDNVDLCPPEACVPLKTYVHSQGGPQDAEVNWQVTNADLDTLAEGTWELSSQGPVYVTADLCLPPGAYSLRVQWPSSTGMALTYGLTQLLYESDGPAGVIAPGGSLVTPFTYYAPCIDVSQTIATNNTTNVSMRLDGRTLWLDLPASNASGNVMLCDALGRRLRSARLTGAATSIDLNGLAAGTYLLVPTNSSAPFPVQRFNLQ